VKLENDPQPLKPIKVAERRLEVLPAGKFDPPGMPRKQAPLPRSVVLIDGIAEKCTYGIHLL
jgi:hypothetical protein